MANPMTADEVRALPASVPIVTAGKAFGMGRSGTFDAYHGGTFPCRVLRVGARRLVVPRAEILRALGIEDVPTAVRVG
jgi:hypothetical protein